MRGSDSERINSHTKDNQQKTVMPPEMVATLPLWLAYHNLAILSLRETITFY